MKILAFAGSLRRESFNQRLLQVALEGARAAGAEVTLISLAEHELPLMNQNLEARDGLPENARKLKDLFLAHDGLLLACPEYNGSITPLLKNTLDWVSRPDGKEAGLKPYHGKVVGLVSASAGKLGGLRGLRHVSGCLPKRDSRGPDLQVGRLQYTEALRLRGRTQPG
jgi:chromate reductase